MNKKFFQHILIIICLFFIGMVSVSAENCTSVKSDIDLYDTYLGGAKAIISIINKTNTSNKELIVFRDSFASSISPLLLDGYSKITLIDTRYISPNLISNYIEFDNQDILFLYSTLIINNSYSLK